MKNIMIYRSGLADKPSSDLFEVEISEEDILLNQIELTLFGKNKVIQAYRIPLKNVVDCGFVSEEEVQKRNKSVVGRGLAGGFLLGPAGLVLGGLSGVGEKEQKKRIGLFVISYLSESSPTELKSFVLGVGWNNHDLGNIKLAKKAQKIAQSAPKSEMVIQFIGKAQENKNSDGSITL